MHPIDKRNFGAKAGKLAVKFYDGSSVRTGWVLAQVGTLKYKVTDGTTTKFARLAQTSTELTALTAGTGPDSALRASLCTIECTPFGGSTENVKKLMMARAITIQGSSFSWKLGTSATATGQGDITLRANVAPTVANAIPDATATVAAAWTYTFPTNTFADLNGDTLTYTSTKGDNSALPGYIVFTPATRTFTKAATAGSTGTITIKVTASDGTNTVSDTFDLVIS